MAQSQVNLYNMALAAVGMDYSLSTVSDTNIGAETCQLFYENVRQTVLRAAHWNVAKQYARLVEVTERDQAADWVTTDPAPGWAYSYDVPSGMLAARYLTSFGRFMMHYDTGNSKMVINANEGSDTASETPILCFTVDVTDVTRFDPDLYQAIIYGLAGAITMPLTGKITRARETIALANEIIMQARANSANEMHQMFEAESRVLQERGYTFPVTQPYVYPYGQLLTATGAPTI